jgi:hypothetical protein
MSDGAADDPDEDRFGQGGHDGDEGERLSTYYRHLGDSRRELYDRDPIDPAINIAAAVRRMPAHWLAAACQVLHLDQDDVPSANRKARSATVLAALHSRVHLIGAIVSMSPRALAALRNVLEAGGCVALIALTQEFGDMLGDGWLWDQFPPTSCIGELRWRAFLHVGRLRVEQDGGLPDLHVPIAVIPQDLRGTLCQLLGVRVENPYGQVEATAETDDWQAALSGVARYYDLPDNSLGLDRPIVEAFLRSVADEGLSARVAWQHVDVLFEFAAHNMHEISTVEDLCGFHLSDFAATFVDRRTSPRWTLPQRRVLIESVARLYTFLHARGRASAAVFDEIREAAATLLAGKRRLNLIKRPLPLGGEPVFIYDDESGSGAKLYSVNHRRIAVTWWTQFDQDWDAMIVACDGVVDGARKATMARELMNLDAAICELLLACADEGEPEFVVDWFRNDPMLLVRAW